MRRLEGPPRLARLDHGPALDRSNHAPAFDCPGARPMAWCEGTGTGRRIDSPLHSREEEEGGHGLGPTSARQNEASGTQRLARSRTSFCGPPAQICHGPGLRCGTVLNSNGRASRGLIHPIAPLYQSHRVLLSVKKAGRPGAYGAQCCTKQQAGSRGEHRASHRRNRRRVRRIRGTTVVRGQVGIWS